MRKLGKRFWVRAGVVVCLFVVGMLGLLWVAAGRIASPERRALLKYHQEYLDTPEAHGMKVSVSMFLEGSVPTVVAVPDGTSGPKERGRLLRSQLGEVLPAYGEISGLLVMLHGRNGRKEDLLPAAERFCAAGFVCVIPDLPAHGESPVETVGFGARNFERSLAGAVADAARKELGLGDLPEFLWGMSMGGSFAIHAAALEPERWERMVIVSSFDTLEGVIGDSWAGWFRWILEPMIKARGGAEVDAVLPVELAAGLSLPTLVVHGDADELIGEARGRALYAALGGEKELVIVPGGTHSNVLVTEAPVYAAMAGWLRGAFRQSP